MEFDDDTGDEKNEGKGDGEEFQLEKDEDKEEEEEEERNEVSETAFGWLAQIEFPNEPNNEPVAIDIGSIRKPPPLPLPPPPTYPLSRWRAFISSVGGVLGAPGTGEGGADKVDQTCWVWKGKEEVKEEDEEGEEVEENGEERIGSRQARRISSIKTCGVGGRWGARWVTSGMILVKSKQMLLYT
jgi:hypothetical protein